MAAPEVRVREHKRRTESKSQYVHRTPYRGADRLSLKIAELRAALDKRVGDYGSKKGVPINEAEYQRMEDTSRLDSMEHSAFQDTQAWAHASGIISYDEAQVIYQSLGEVGDEANGGWASHTDLATKIIVQQITMELLGIKIRMKGSI